jgi:hypothetical protein
VVGRASVVVLRNGLGAAVARSAAAMAAGAVMLLLMLMLLLLMLLLALLLALLPVLLLLGLVLVGGTFFCLVVAVVGVRRGDVIDVEPAAAVVDVVAGVLLPVAVVALVAGSRWFCLETRKALAEIMVSS